MTSSWAKTTNFEDVLDWHRYFGLAIGDRPDLAAETTNELRVELIREEFEELVDAVARLDIVEVADALADMLYVLHGAAVTWGIPLDEVFREVHRSNMTKLGEDGKPVLRADGKILKGPHYSAPRLQPILFPSLAGYEEEQRQWMANLSAEATRDTAVRGTEE